MSKRQRMPKKQEERIRKATENLERIQERLAPYIKRREYVDYSTAGRWGAPSEFGIGLTRREFFETLERVSRPLEDRPCEGKPET
jgi:hypothetical protein